MPKLKISQNKMDQELKQNWVDALRSGKYKQARSVLRTKNNEFCCIGVLCDLVDPHAWILEHTTGINPSIEGIPWSKMGTYLMPPLEWQEEIANQDTLGAYSELNDDGASFEEIADRIETDPEL